MSAFNRLKTSTWAHALYITLADRWIFPVLGRTEKGDVQEAALAHLES
jgi:hypothetical protein